MKTRRLVSDKWFVVSRIETLIYEADSFDEAKSWKDSQPDADKLKLSAWKHGRKVIPRR